MTGRKLGWAKASDELKSEDSIKNLAEKSQEAYSRESVLPAEKKELKSSVDVLNGIFIAPELHWDSIVQALKARGEYEPKPHHLGEIMEKMLGLEDVFPPTAIERNFPPGDKSFCRAEIKFTPRLLSKSNAVYHLKKVKEQANETDEWAKPLMDWLESQKAPGFYFVIEFEIVCVFDFEQYTRTRVPDLFKEIQAKMKEESEDQESLTKESVEWKKLVEWATTLLENEARELAEWATEYVAKEQVLEDLCYAIDAACETSSAAEEESTPKGGEARDAKNLQFRCARATLIMLEPVKNEGPPKKSLPFKHPILTYKPVKLKLIAYINDKDKDVEIRLGEEIKARIELLKREEDKIDVKDLRVIIESEYFEEKEKIITFADESGRFPQWAESHEEFPSITAAKEAKPHEKFQGITALKDAKLRPDISKITKNEKKLVEYPVTFKLVRFSGNKVSGTTAQYCKTQLNVEFKLPEIGFKMRRQYFPRKGEQLDVDFDVWCKSDSSPDYPIPVRVVCYPGEDFSTVKPLHAETKSVSENLKIYSNAPKTARAEIHDTIRSSPETKQATNVKNATGKRASGAHFALIAKRFSFPGYYNSAYFEFFVGDDPIAVDRWRLNITVLPNLLDTLVAGGTGLLGILSAAYPDFFPTITQGVSIANLEIIPATIYLVYRVLNWSRKT